MSINRQVGICHQDDVTKAMLVLLRQLLIDKGWYSGDRNYPIEHPTLLISAKNAYWDSSDDLWDENCPYCQRRIQIFKELTHAV